MPLPAKSGSWTGHGSWITPGVNFRDLADRWARTGLHASAIILFWGTMLGSSPIEGFNSSSIDSGLSPPPACQCPNAIALREKKALWRSSLLAGGAFRQSE